MTSADENVVVRRTRRKDFDGIISLSRAVYPGSPSWTEQQLASHLEIFPEGQLVAVTGGSETVVGMAASLIVHWDDYDANTSWRDFTDRGMFTNHDPARGRTLYGAEVMVHPEAQRRGIGKRIYRARETLVRKLGLRRIRAGARLPGYHEHAHRLTAEQYVREVVANRLSDPTLGFQLRQGFHVIGIVSDYLRSDPESLGFAAIIEWINDEVATAEDYSAQRRWRDRGGP